MQLRTANQDYHATVKNRLLLNIGGLQQFVTPSAKSISIDIVAAFTVCPTYIFSSMAMLSFHQQKLYMPNY